MLTLYKIQDKGRNVKVALFVTILSARWRIFMYENNKPYTEQTFCPYRVCPLGAHVDHQYGLVTGFALDKGVKLDYVPTEDGSFFVSSRNFDGIVAFKLNDLPGKQGNWGDFLLGSIVMLSKQYEITKGFNAVIEGTMPVGGLSSSAAVIITYLITLCKCNDIHLTQPQLIKYAIMVERDYIGVNVGKLDQSCEVYCKKDHLLVLDTLDDKSELVPFSANMPNFKIAIIYSGVSRKLAGSAYNTRVDECKAAAYALKGYAGMDYGKFEDTRLREVPFGVYDEFKDKLPENWRKRAEHYYAEQQRVERGVKAWRNGDIEEFGKAIFESGESSINKYEAGSDPLKALYNIMCATDGIYGGRFSGAGFNGCCMAIVDPSKEEYIREQITKEYSQVFPEYMKDFQIVFCNTADGVKY